MGEREPNHVVWSLDAERRLLWSLRAGIDRLGCPCVRRAAPQQAWKVSGAAN